MGNRVRTSNEFLWFDEWKQEFDGYGKCWFVFRGGRREGGVSKNLLELGRGEWKELPFFLVLFFLFFGFAGFVIRMAWYLGRCERKGYILQDFVICCKLDRYT